VWWSYGSFSCDSLPYQWCAFPFFPCLCPSPCLPYCWDYTALFFGADRHLSLDHLQSHLLRVIPRATCTYICLNHLVLPLPSFDNLEISIEPSIRDFVLPNDHPATCEDGGKRWVISPAWFVQRCISCDSLNMMIEWIAVEIYNLMQIYKNKW